MPARTCHRSTVYEQMLYGKLSNTLLGRRVFAKVKNYEAKSEVSDICDRWCTSSMLRGISFEGYVQVIDRWIEVRRFLV